MSSFIPSPPWTLHCPRCEYYIVVFARGAHGKDHGSGVEAADAMRRHSAFRHPETAAEGEHHESTDAV